MHLLLLCAIWENSRLYSYDLAELGRYYWKGPSIATGITLTGPNPQPAARTHAALPHGP
jgi:hypothetical protein